jgi:hypothetical protein
MADDFREPLLELTRALAPWATGGTQINFLTGYDTAPSDVAKAYEPAAYERLRRIKRVCDPANLFRINHNIPPHR